MTMREKIARALCVKYGHDPDKLMVIDKQTPMWMSFVDAVDVALDELMTPSDDLIAHGMIVPKMIDAGSWWIKGLRQCFVDIVSAAKDGA